VPSPSHDLREQFGEIDIYLFDQILKGRFDNRRRVLDAGCGDGRNLIYFLRNGYDCFGVDAEPGAIASLQRTAADLSPRTPQSNFIVGDVQNLPYSDAAMDVVISSAVLHFAQDEAQFARMLEEMWRVLSPGGLFFARLASNIGIEDRVPTARTRVRLPDGSERFVVDEPMLLDWTGRLGGQLADPIKTTNVQQLRCMTTWCVLK
jgi:SAM-dependent methyltransferase